MMPSQNTEHSTHELDDGPFTSSGLQQPSPSNATSFSYGRKQQ